MSLTTSEQPRANKFGVGKFLQGGTPGERMCLPWLLFVNATKQAHSRLFYMENLYKIVPWKTQIR